MFRPNVDQVVLRRFCVLDVFAVGQSPDTAIRQFQFPALCRDFRAGLLHDRLQRAGLYIMAVLTVLVFAAHKRHLFEQARSAAYRAPGQHNRLQGRHLGRRQAAILG